MLLVHSSFLYNLYIKRYISKKKKKRKKEILKQHSSVKVISIIMVTKNSYKVNRREDKREI